MFMHVVTDHAVRAKGASELMEEYMDASNFGVCKIILFKYFCDYYRIKNLNNFYYAEVNLLFIL